MRFTTIAVLAGVVATAVPCRAQAPTAKPQAPSVNPSAAVIAAFTQRVNAYAALRKGVEKGEAKVERHTDPAKIEAEQKALVAKIQAARTAAKVGDIFTIESRPVFKRLLSPQLKGPDGAENKAAIKDDNPGAMTLKVNQPYPKREPLSTVPPDILKALPVLPQDVEYRFVGKHLILYDARASLIIDFIPNAIP
ncbi:MAG: hypothetical protein Q7R30_00870 [Acidobacteriota bacterium]|nr:hypothetical protein [Acidobacteriota bacterium]